MLSIAHRWGVCDLKGQRLSLSYSYTGWYAPQALNRSTPLNISVLKQIEWCHHDPHHEIHTHRKLLDLEGSENYFFRRLIRYTPECFTKLDFFFICDFWRDIGKILWKFVIFLIWREKQSASGVRLWTTNKKKWWAYKWPVARSSKGHRSAVSCLNKMQKIRNSFLNIWPKLCSHKFSPIQLDLKLRVTFRFMRVNNFWHLIKIKEI